MKFLISVILSFGLVQHAFAEECLMKPAVIDVGRIARHPAIKTFIVDKKKLALSGLLTNGRAFRLRHMGCEYSGAMAALWFDSTLPLSDAKTWSKEIADFARIAFAPNEANEISASLHSGKVTTTVTDDRLVIDGAPEIFIRYTVTVAPAEEGIVMTITYSLG